MLLRVVSTGFCVRMIKVTPDVHIVSIDAHQYQAAIALLIFGADFAVVRGTACRFFLVGLLKVVRSNHGIFGV